MELRHLRALLKLRETLHFGRAAEALAISQPALTLQIQQLEKECRVSLVERTRGAIRLTQAGEVMTEYASRSI
jgi:DNA-binding transcriptional LysR family regulator